MGIQLQIGNKISALPNLDGFTFRGVEQNGDLTECVVKQCDDGIHRIFDEDGERVPMDRLRGWMRKIPKIVTE